jgi:hypothetical protein
VALRRSESELMKRLAAHSATARSNEALPAKVALSEPGDRHEREAERRAGEVTRDASTSGSARPPAGHDGPLEPRDRRFYESRFNHDFAGVRVHADGEADRSARAFEARAFTVDDDISFAAGEYRPDTRAGARLLAHELAHVVQQRNSVGLQPHVIQRQAQNGTTQQTPPAKQETLKDEGVDVSDPVTGDKTPQIIDAVLQRNARLAPYIGDRLKKGFSIAEKGHFVKEISDSSFDSAYNKAYQESGTVPASTMGFYDDKASTVHLRPDAKFGTALHEAIHRLASPKVYDLMQIAVPVSKDLVAVLLEGVTAFFTDCVLKDEGLPNFNDAYRDLKRKAEGLLAALGPDGFAVLARYNFKTGSVYEIGKKLGMTDKQYVDLKADSTREIFKLIEKAL